jgi:transposase
MKDNTKYVGLDVSKEKIAVAIADDGREVPSYWGVILNTPEAIRKLLKQLGEPDQLKVCYEAGPTGYPLYRLLLSLGIECSVIAPSLIPKKAGERVKTDRRDAIRLAQLFRAGELTSIYVPTEDDEALRDLVRAREDSKEDQLRARHRLTKFLLRYDLNSPAGIKKWTQGYRDWLDALKFSRGALSTVFREYLHHLDEIEERVKRLEAEIHIQATESVNAPIIQALQTMRGVAELTATSLVAEIGSFTRFNGARKMMAYTGLIPSEHSSGETRKQGKMTKTGNTHVRRLLIEAAWSYRYKPALKGEIRKRQEGQSPEIKAIAWKAQERLHRKYYRLMDVENRVEK